MCPRSYTTHSSGVKQELCLLESVICSVKAQHLLYSLRFQFGAQFQFRVISVCRQIGVFFANSRLCQSAGNQTILRFLAQYSLQWVSPSNNDQLLANQWLPGEYLINLWGYVSNLIKCYYS